MAAKENSVWQCDGYALTYTFIRLKLLFLYVNIDVLLLVTYSSQT